MLHPLRWSSSCASPVRCARLAGFLLISLGLATLTLSCGGGGSSGDRVDDCNALFEPVGPQRTGHLMTLVPTGAFPLYPEFTGWGTDGTSFTMLGYALEEEGEHVIEVLVPFDSGDTRDEMWELRVDITGGEFSCRGLRVQVEPLPEAAVDLEGIADRLERLTDLALEFAEVSTTAELGIPGGNPLEVPLIVARDFVDGHENSFRAVIDGSAPVLEGEELDADFLARLYASVGLPDLLDQAIEELEVLVATEKRVGGCMSHPFHPETVEDLACWMRIGRNAETLTSGVVGQVLNVMGVLINLVGLIPHPVTRAAATGGAIGLAISQLVLDAMADILPSRLLPLSVSLTIPEFVEDSDEIGGLARVDLYAENNGYDLTLSRIVDVMMLATGLAGVRSALRIGSGDVSRLRQVTLEALVDAAEDALMVVAQGLYQALIGVLDSMANGGGLTLMAQTRIGPVDVTDEEYTEFVEDIVPYTTQDAVWIDRDARTYGANFVGARFVEVRMTAGHGLPQIVEGSALARVVAMELSISPDPLRVSPGADGRFFQSVENGLDDSGDWSASVGTMGVNGRYTAPDEEGEFVDAVRFESTATGGARSHPDAPVREAFATVITEDCCGDNPPPHCDQDQCDCPDPPDPEACDDSSDFEEECGQFMDAGNDLGAFEGGTFSPGFDACLCPNPPDECEPPDPDCEGPSCRPPPMCTGACNNFRGDPWLRSFDGLFFGFQAVGEFVLTRSTVDEFEVQVRTEPLNNSVSLTSMVGIRMEETRLTLANDRTPALHVNGSPEPVGDGYLALDDGVRIWRDGSTYLFSRPDGLNVYARIAFGEVMVDQDVPLTLAGELEGLSGDADGDPSNDIRPRGQAPLSEWDDFEVFYGVFAESWRISDEESLLDYGTGEDTETWTDRSYPRLEPDTSLISDEARAAAEALCREAGITRNPWLEACIIDVVMRGDEAVGSFGGVRRPTMTARILRAPLARGADLGNPVDIIRDTAGFVAADNNGRLLRIDREGEVSVVAEDDRLMAASTVALDGGDFLVATGYGYILRVTEGGTVTTVVDDERFSFYDLVHDEGSSWWALHTGFEAEEVPDAITASSIARVNLASGTAEVVHSIPALAGSFRMRLADDGTFYVTDQNSGLYAVSSTGSVNRVGGALMAFSDPLDVELLGDDRFLLGLRNGNVVEVDASDGSGVVWASVSQFPTRLIRLDSSVIAADFGDFEGTGTIWRLLPREAM